MRKTGLLIFVCASLLILVSASVWEGAASVASGGELPDSGLYVATNSFPANTVVDVTNLENGKTTRVIASSGLDTPGLLALLSRDAASAIGLQSRSLGRVRMSQPADPIAFSRFTEGLVSSGDPDYDPAAFVALDGIPLDESYGEENGRMENGDLIVDLPDTGTYAAAGDLPDYSLEPESMSGDLVPFMPAVIADDSITPDDGPFVAEIADYVTAVETPAPVPEGDFDLSFVPADSRPPEQGPEPELSQIIPGIREESDSDFIDPALIIDPVGEAPLLAETGPGELPPGDFPEPGIPGPVDISELTFPAPEQIFSAPLVSNLEKGKYYLQIAAYSKAETVESELSKIGAGYPLTIMNAGDTEKPLYRVLIGPVNLGESGALLQRFKVSHKDVFVRLGT